MFDKTILMYEIQRDDVENLRYVGIAEALRTLDKRMRDKLVMTFGGYDHDVRELHEVDEVRTWVKGLFEKYPYILYYANQDFKTFQTLLQCYLDFEMFFTGERMNSYEIEAKLISGELEKVPTMPIYLILPKEKEVYLVKHLKQYGLKIHDLQGANRTIKDLKKIFEK
jgi:hypothetical protein